jgi:hypothetical protein
VRGHEVEVLDREASADQVAGHAWWITQCAPLAGDEEQAKAPAIRSPDDRLNVVRAGVVDVDSETLLR